MDIALLNGEPTMLTLTHRGLAFGDGLFETCLASSGRIHRLPMHLARLLKGCSVLNLPFNASSTASLSEQLNKLSSDLIEPHVVKIMVLRSINDRGYDFDPETQQCDTVILITPYHRPSWSEGARVISSDVPISENAYLAGIKHLNRLDSVLSRQEARRVKVDDALMVTQTGLVIESTMANVFFKIDGGWVTPSIDVAGVSGIIRQQLLQQFKEQILVQSVDLNMLSKVESAFMTNSLLGLVPIIEINHRPLNHCQTITTFNQFVRQLRD